MKMALFTWETLGWALGILGNGVAVRIGTNEVRSLLRPVLSPVVNMCLLLTCAVANRRALWSLLVRTSSVFSGRSRKRRRSGLPGKPTTTRVSEKVAKVERVLHSTHLLGSTKRTHKRGQKALRKVARAAAASRSKSI